MPQPIFHNHHTDPQKPLLHATGVAAFGRGVLIVGQSGSGKSGLALRLLALGAELVADDRVVVQTMGDTLWMTRPPQLPAMLEARGFALIPTPVTPQAPLSFVVNMSKISKNRMPVADDVSILNQTRRMYAGQDVPNLAEAVFLLLKYGTNHEAVN